ncbi:hypothetical protein [Aquamicrobium defluvii]|uniref:Uncharacterized protein n=1 Tax=Aquamicrobium defluvii TaxID=69279 RepID=A0A011UV11_9HYPH|nr:hypothetical protein [Aquamicrobium defluvii]EXL09733.1 hypothetical protein BG36_21055 [Aquamicrobium defluvii]EZQ16483.1 hypothetical protein CF98_40665 [Halopseudomonas bauzanensis]
MVERFEFTCHDSDPDIVSVNHGRWVSFSDYEALRSELEQARRERDGFRDIAARKSDQVAALIKAEAAERLAGARVKATSDELSRYIERCRELSDGGEYSWWSRLAEILSALAEPAGEVEPVAWRYRYNGKWYVCDSEAVARLGWDVTPLYTNPPDASAIREALERGQAFANQVRAVTCHLNGQAYSSTVSALNYFDAALSRAALAGAKP